MVLTKKAGTNNRTKTKVASVWTNPIVAAPVNRRNVLTETLRSLFSM